MTVKALLKPFVNSSETGKLLNQSKQIYKTTREDSGRIKSLYSATKYGYKELGIVNSVFAGIGVVTGTILPIPCGSIIVTEGLLQMSKYSGKYAKIVGKNIAKIV